MEFFYKCPKCNDNSYADIIPAIGRRLECPYCKNIFPFSADRLVGEGDKYGPKKYYSQAELTKLLANSDMPPIAPKAAPIFESEKSVEQRQETINEVVADVPVDEASFGTKSIKSETKTLEEIEEQTTDPDKDTEAAIEETSFAFKSNECAINKHNQSKQQTTVHSKDAVSKLSVDETHFADKTAEDSVIKQDQAEQQKIDAVKDIVADVSAEEYSSLVSQDENIASSEKQFETKTETKTTNEEPTHTNAPQPIDAECSDAESIKITAIEENTIPRLATKAAMEDPKKKDFLDITQCTIHPDDKLQAPYPSANEIIPPTESFREELITSLLKSPLPAEISHVEINPSDTDMTPSSREINPLCK